MCTLKITGGLFNYEEEDLRRAVTRVLAAPRLSSESVEAAANLHRVCGFVSSGLAYAQYNGAPALILEMTSHLAARLQEGESAPSTRTLLLSIAKLLACSSSWTSKIPFLSAAHAAAGDAVLAGLTVPGGREAALHVHCVAVRSYAWRRPLLDVTLPSSALFLSCLDLASSRTVTAALAALSALCAYAHAPVGSLSRILLLLSQCAVEAPECKLDSATRSRIASAALSFLGGAVSDVTVLPELELSLEPGEQPEFARTVCSLCTHVTQTAAEFAADPRRKAPMPPDGPLFRDSEILSSAISVLLGAFQATVRLGRGDLTRKLMSAVSREFDFQGAVQARADGRHIYDARQATDLQQAVRYTCEAYFPLETVMRIIWGTPLNVSAALEAQLSGARALASRIAASEGGAALEADSRALLALATDEPAFVLFHVPAAAHACASRLLDAPSLPISAACALMGVLGALCAVNTGASQLARDPAVVAAVLSHLSTASAPVFAATVRTLTSALERGGHTCGWLEACAEVADEISAILSPVLEGGDHPPLVRDVADLYRSLVASESATILPSTFLADCVTSAVRGCNALVTQLYEQAASSPQTPPLPDADAQPALHSTLKLMSKLCRIAQFEPSESPLCVALSGLCNDGSVSTALLPLVGGRFESEHDGAVQQRATGSKRKERSSLPGLAPLAARAVRLLGQLLDGLTVLHPHALTAAVQADEDAMTALQFAARGEGGYLREAALSILGACGEDYHNDPFFQGSVWDPAEDDSFFSAHSYGHTEEEEEEADDFADSSPPRFAHWQPDDEVPSWMLSGLEQLVEMGFSEEKARVAIKFTEGNVGDAAIRLMMMS